MIHSFAGIHFNIGVALHIMPSKTSKLLNNAYTLATMPDITKVIFKINQVFLDRNPSQNETLLQPHQVRAFCIVVDDCAVIHIRTGGTAEGQYL